jgi:hypothetical protein
MVVPGIPVRRSIDGQFEEVRHAPDVETVQKRPVEEDGSAGSPLGVSRELPLPLGKGQGQVRMSFDADLRFHQRLEGRDLTLQDPSVRRVDRLQCRSRPWIQGDAVAEASRALEHGAATRSPTEDWDVGMAACLNVSGVGDALAVPDHDKWNGGFPEPEELAAGGFGLLQKRIVPGQQFGRVVRGGDIYGFHAAWIMG